MSHLHSPRATQLIYLHSANNKVKAPWPSTQLQLLLEHPRAMFPRQLEANGRQCNHPGADSRARWLTTTVPQRVSTTIYTTHRSLLLWYSCNPPAILLSIQQYSHYDSYIDTAISYVTRLLLIQTFLLRFPPISAYLSNHTITSPSHQQKPTNLTWTQQYVPSYIRTLYTSHQR